MTRADLFFAAYRAWIGLCLIFVACLLWAVAPALIHRGF